MSKSMYKKVLSSSPRHVSGRGPGDAKGVTLPMSLAIAVVFGVAVLFTAQMFRIFTEQTNYLGQMDRTYKLAESAVNETLGKLSADPGWWLVSGALDNPFPLGDGQYTVFIGQRNLPTPGIYYIRVRASRNVHGREFSSTLHTYADISNVSDYFAAVKDAMTISTNVNVSQGKIYARSLIFITDAVPSPPKTIVKRAEFVESCTPAINDQGTEDVMDDQWANPATLDEVEVLEPIPGRVPRKIPYPVVFPDLLDYDIQNFRTLAGPHTTVNNFTGEIYPPGYNGFAGPEAGDTYHLQPGSPGHTTNNVDHVYYYAGDMSIEGTVHGQVLFVATGDIHLKSSVLSAVGPIPGAGAASSSTAHQAIFITRSGKVIIDATFYKVSDFPNPKTQQIQGLVFVPGGTFRATPYADLDGAGPYTPADVHNNLELEFTGSLILATLNPSADPNDPEKIPNVFRRRRAYAYMDSLTLNPPPYLPSLIDVYASMEDTK